MDHITKMSIDELRDLYLTIRRDTLSAFGGFEKSFDHECYHTMMASLGMETPINWVKAAQTLAKERQQQYEEGLAAEQAKEDADQLKYEEYIERKYNMSKEG